jgi:hypothetical protein
MPKLRHEAVVEIMQNEPELVLRLLVCAGVHLRFGPRAKATAADSDLSDRDAADGGWVLTLLSDNIFVFTDAGAKLAVVAEVQTGPPGKSRSLSWPAYAANARARHKCDSILMVFATNPNAARGSAKVIPTGHPGWDLAPLVCGIGRMPGTPPEGGRFAAELVLLHIITGELTLGSHDSRMFALAAVKSAPLPRRLRYARYIRALAPSRARKPLEELMTTVLKDDFMDGLIAEGLQKGIEKGIEKGLQKGIEKGLRKGLKKGLEKGSLQKAQQMMLQLLDKRFSVPDDIRKRIETCTDTAAMDTWFDRAITATSLDEVFAELAAGSAPAMGSRSEYRFSGDAGIRTGPFRRTPPWRRPPARAW